MQQFMKQLGLVCMLSVSTITCGVRSQDQLGVNIHQLALQLTQICNDKCSASSRASIRDVLIEGRPAFVYQLRLIEQGLSLDQLLSDELVIEFRDTFGYRLLPVQEEVENDLQDKGEFVDVMMMVRDMVDTFCADNQKELTKLMAFDTSTATTKKAIEYWLLVIDTALENLQ